MVARDFLGIYLCGKKVNLHENQITVKKGGYKCFNAKAHEIHDRDMEHEIHDRVL